MTPNEAPSTLLESLGTLRDSEHLGVVTANEQRVLDANDAYLQMIGCTRDELERGAIDWQAITPPDHLVRDQHALQELRSFGACVPFEKEYVRKDGTTVPVLIGAVRIRAHPLEWACFVVDMREQKAAASIEERTRELQEKTRLVNYLAHEINNPLAIVVQTMYLLQSSANLDPQSRLLVDQASRAVDRITQTVAALLAAATDTALPR